MSLVVDGYNLLFTAGMELCHLGPGTLERARAPCCGSWRSL